MPSWVDITGPAFVVVVDVGKVRTSGYRGRGMVEGIVRSRWGRNCCWNVLYERRLIK